MPKPIAFIVSLLVMTVATACQASGRSSEGHEAEAGRLRKRSQLLVAAEGRRDIDAVVGYYASDAVIEPPGSPLVQGREAIRQFYEEFYRTIPFASFTGAINSLEVAAAGDLAYETGVNRFEFDRGGVHTEDRGKYLIVWRKAGGERLVVAVAFSADHPGP